MRKCVKKKKNFLRSSHKCSVLRCCNSLFSETPGANAKSRTRAGQTKDISRNRTSRPSEWITEVFPRHDNTGLLSILYFWSGAAGVQDVKQSALKSTEVLKKIYVMSLKLFWSCVIPPNCRLFFTTLVQRLCFYSWVSPGKHCSKVALSCLATTCCTSSTLRLVVRKVSYIKVNHLFGN